MPCWTMSPWLRNLIQMASGRPGAVHLDYAYERYLTDPTQVWGARTREAYETSRRLAVSVIGRDTPMSTISRSHCRNFINVLRFLPRDGVRRAYTRGEYWNERVTMMQWWSGELGRLSNGSKLLKPNFRGNVQAQEDEGQSRRFAS